MEGELTLSCSGLRQRKLDRVIDQIENIVLVGKADFGFCRMNVDIHKVGRHLEKQDSSRELALHGGAFEGHLHTGHHGAVADIAAIDIEVLHTPAGTAALGLGDKTVDPVRSLGVVQFDKAAREFPAKNGVSGSSEGAIAGRDILEFALPDKFEADFGMTEGDVTDDVRHKGSLAGIFFQELHPGRRVVEEVAHPNRGADAARARLDGLLFPTLDAVAGSAVVVFGTGQDFDTGNAGNGRQCFAAETEGVDMVQVILRLNLAGGVADERRGDILLFDAAAVVADFDELDAA